MKIKKEILTIDDIKTLVDNFYGKVQEDDILKDIFNEVIKDHWPEHVEKMYRFWQTILLKEHTYYGNPFSPHVKLPVKKKHFDRWKLLFSETINDHFVGEKAIEAQWRAEKMAEMFQHKITYYQNNQSIPLL